MYKLHADVIQWDSIENKWKLTNYFIRFIKGEEEYVFRGSSMDTTLALSPKDFYQDKRNVETMNFFQLNRFIEQEKIKGSDEVPFFQVEKHKRIAYPFSAIILTLIAVSLSSKKTRGGIGLHLGIGIALSFIYIMFMQITTTFATNGNLHPFMAVWIPNILFAVVATWLVYKAPK
jgi:lipopolysaccharide export system permease protein